MCYVYQFKIWRTITFTCRPAAIEWFQTLAVLSILYFIVVSPQALSILVLNIKPMNLGRFKWICDIWVRIAPALILKPVITNTVRSLASKASPSSLGRVWRRCGARPARPRRTVTIDNCSARFSSVNVCFVFNGPNYNLFLGLVPH